MPVSKHRRKPGGKAARHPGRGKTGHRWPKDPLIEAFKAFNDRYEVANMDIMEACYGARYMAEIVVGRVWRYNEATTPTNKTLVFAEFTKVFDDPDDPDTDIYTLEDAENALAYLVQHDLLAVSGDTITIPERFLTP